MTANYLSIEEVTANAMTVIKEATNEDRLFMQTWVVQAMRDIGPNVSWVKTCQVTNEDGFMDKPNDLTSLIGISLWNAEGQEVAYRFHAIGGPRIHTDRFAVRSAVVEPADPAPWNVLDLSEDAFHWIVAANSNVAYALIKYYAMPTDRDGMPLVPENNVIAYMMYVRWMWELRKNDNRSAIDQNYSMWLDERNKVKGNNKMPSMVEADAIAKSWFSLLSTYKSPNF